MRSRATSSSGAARGLRGAAPPNHFDLTIDDLLSLRAAANGVTGAVQAQSGSEADLRMKVRAKDDALGAAGLALSATARKVLASGATGAELLSIGFSRPAKPVRPTALPAPTDLVAKVLTDGSVRLAWARDGSPQGTTFAVEWSPDGLAWEMIEATTRASLTMPGYAPGVAAWFRVSAKRSGLTSPASGSASVYAPGALARPQLKVA